MLLLTAVPLLLAGAAHAQTPAEVPPPSALAPLDFLAGHCWRGTLPGGDTDTHCFAAAPGAIRDHHEVAREGRTVYAGDTVYAWSDGALRWTYRDATGGVMKGSVSAAPDGLDFGTADYQGTDGARITIATRWVRIGDNAYEARDTSQVAAHNRATRYTRID